MGAFIALVAISILVILPAAATPPSAVIVSYNEQSSELSVTITHPVADPATHYIREIVVAVNGRTVTDTQYTSQPSKDTFTRIYPLRVKPGDRIEVTAICSIAGSGSSSIEVPPNGATATVPVTQKAATGLIPLLGAAIFLMIKK
jgi:sulfur carrier protein ThiS